jgi:hypothetical protein
MSTTRKEFVQQVVEELKANPRAVLAGHGIAPAVLQTIIARPDVMSKLATVLYSTKYAKKMAAGLKKAVDFKISGYKSAGALIDEGREDIEKFIGGLADADAAKFNNAGNILVILIQPEAPKTGDETTAEEIVSGKSVTLTFDQAISRAYKIPGAMYLTVMLADSAARPTEVAVAERKVKVNKVKQAKRTPAKIMAELKSKANKKLEILKAKRSALEETAFLTEKELEQYGNVANEFGGKTLQKGMANWDKTVEGKKEIANAVNGLDAEAKKLFQLALDYKKNGKIDLAKAMLKEIGNPIISKYVLKDGESDLEDLRTSDEVVAGRRLELKRALKILVQKNDQYIVDLALAPDNNKKLSIRSMISKNNSKIRDIRAKLGTYKNLSTAAMNKKAAMLQETHANIEANIAAGDSINTALNNALATLDAKPAQKQIIKQQIMEQVANGSPMQYAVQQAIQDNIQEVPAVTANLGNSELSGDFQIQSLLDSL